MGIATFPASSSGLASVVKSIQRGTASTAGNITITSVDTTKTQVLSFSTGSAGTVAATGTVNAANGSTSAVSTSSQSGNISLTIGNTNSQYSNMRPGANYSYNPRYGVAQFAGYAVNGSQNVNAMNINGANVGLNATNITGGSTSLTSAVYGAYLVNATTIYATGPCRYEVVEYY